MKIELEVSSEKLASLMTTAIESGDPVTTAARGGWCVAITSLNNHPFGPTWYNEPAYWSQNFSIEVTEYHEEDNTKTKHKVGPSEFKNGLVVMATKFPRLFGQIMQDNIDASCADIFLQCVVFGEEKYA